MRTHLSTDQKLKLITRNCQEILTAGDLRVLLESGTPLTHYIGFEISGLVHLGTGLMSMGKIADFLKAGVKCTLFLADFHSYLNRKLGGDWKLIREMTNSYFRQGLVASLACFGVGESEVAFITGHDLYAQNLIHWETFMEVGKHVTLSRNLRSISIMGKQAGEDVDMATLFYPPLQVADIFTMRVNLAHAGVDQRKAHVVARQVAKKLTINPLTNSNSEVIAPVAVHQNLIAGLDAPSTSQLQTITELQGDDCQEAGTALKMSKSKPGSAIFIHDSPDEITAKIRRAYCPPSELDFNPIINWVETLIFWGQKEGNFAVTRKPEHGGNTTYTNIDQLKADYQSGALHPMDLKAGVGEWLITKLAPARAHFAKPEHRKALEKMAYLVNR